MNIAGYVVSVGYSDVLELSIDKWRAGLDELVIVTAPADDETFALCRDKGVACHVTDVFYRSGAVFNKSGAIDEAMAQYPRPDWTLLIDADVEPPANWRAVIRDAAPRAGNLYGARRMFDGGQPIPDAELAGFFMLFHRSDPATVEPLGHWHNAGSYDSQFMSRWPSEGRIILPLELIHHGDAPGRNWCGRGNDAGLLAMRMERAKRGGWQHERIG